MAVVEGKNRAWNVPGGSGIKGQASSSGSVGSILGGRTETPHALKQLSSMLQLLSLPALGLELHPSTAMRIPHAAAET